MQTVTSILAPLLEQLVPMLGAVLLAVGSYAAKRAADWLRLSNDAQVRGYLNEVIENAVGWAEADMKARLARAAADGATPAPKRDDWGTAVDSAAGYVATRVPDALAHFGITPQGLRQIIQTRLSGV